MSDRFEELYRNAFDEDPIRDYLEKFYSTQGGIEFPYLKGAEYILLECNQCGLIFQRDVLSDELLEKLYGEWIDPEIIFRQHLHQEGLPHYSAIAQEVMQIISCFNSVPSSLEFFDFGMGRGQWAIMAKAFGCKMFGLELTRESNSHAQSHGIDVLSWEEIPLHVFDFINTEQVFEHLTNPLETLLHLVKALKPGGMIKISVPTAHDIDRRLKIMDWSAPKFSRNSLNPVAPLEHINFFRRRSIITMAGIAGLQETHVPMFNQYRYLTNWSGLWSIAMKMLQPVRRVAVKDQNYCLFRFF